MLKSGLVLYFITEVGRSVTGRSEMRNCSCRTPTGQGLTVWQHRLAAVAGLIDCDGGAGQVMLSRCSLLTDTPTSLRSAGQRYQ